MFNSLQELLSNPINTAVIREGNAPIEDIHCADTVIHWDPPLTLRHFTLESQSFIAIWVVV